jgi:thioredoxin reductase
VFRQISILKFWNRIRKRNQSESISETSVQNIYAIGDCAEQREAIGLRRPIEAVWYTGRMMGEVLAQTLTGNPTA